MLLQQVKLYRDQELLGAFATNSTLLPITSLLVGQEEDCSGGCFAQNQCTNGRINNLCFWNRALNEDEVAALCRLLPQKDGANLPENGLAIYPNPVTDVLQLSKQDIEKVNVYDLNGHLMQTNVHAQKINVESLSPGLYLLKAFEADGNFTMLKFIKQ